MGGYKRGRRRLNVTGNLLIAWIITFNSCLVKSWKISRSTLYRLLFAIAVSVPLTFMRSRIVDALTDPLRFNLYPKFTETV